MHSLSMVTTGMCTRSYTEIKVNHLSLVVSCFRHRVDESCPTDRLDTSVGQLHVCAGHLLDAFLRIEQLLLSVTQVKLLKPSYQQYRKWLSDIMYNHIMNNV